jgi:hypothetical protein
MWHKHHVGLVKRQGFSKQPARISGRPDREVNEEHPAGLDQSNPVDTATANFATDRIGYAASSTSATNADGRVTIDNVALNLHARVAGEAPTNMRDFVKLHAAEFKQRGPAHS